MANIIQSIKISNFRGIKSQELTFSNLNLFVGDNGTNKTSVLEAINYVFSPAFLSGRIKIIDFVEGNDVPIKIKVQFKDNFKVKLPDGYTTQEIECNKVSLTIKLRERKSPGKLFSDLVTINHLVLPIFDKTGDTWKIKRKSGAAFKFNERLLSFGIFETDELPRTFYFNKDRDKQLYKGFNTSFSSFAEDLNWRFLKKSKDQSNNKLHDDFNQLEQNILNATEFEKNEVVKEFNERISNFGLDIIEISFLDNLQPYDQASFVKKFSNLNLPAKYLGSGIEMIYSLLFLDTLASLSKEKLLILIDEPELHLHPLLQEKLAEYLHDLSENEKYQIFITTHSPIFYKNLINRSNVSAFICNKTNENSIQKYTETEPLFPWSPSWGEINYFAFNYTTVEFFNELYGYLMEISACSSCKNLDEWLNKQYKIYCDNDWTPERNGQPQQTEKVSLMTYIRHKIHHPENKTMQQNNYTNEELKKCIDKMIEIIRKKQ